jgi:hypothetical protein
MSAQSANRAAYAALGQKNVGPIITKKVASSVIDVNATRQTGRIQQTAVAAPAVDRFAGPQQLDAQRFMIASTAAANAAKSGATPSNRFAGPLMPSLANQNLSIPTGASRIAQRYANPGSGARVTGAGTFQAPAASRYGPGKFASPRLSAQAFSSRYPAVIPATPATVPNIPGVPLGSSRVKRATPNVRRATPNVLRTPASGVGARLSAASAPSPFVDVTAPIMPVSTLGDEDGDRTLYAQWAASVKSNGGVATVLPPGHAVYEAGWPAGRYPIAIANAKVNGGTWRPADLFTKDGQYAYFVAPAQVKEAAYSLGIAKPGEVPSSGFFDSINILGGPGDMLRKVAIGGAILGGLLLFREFR